MEKLIENIEKNKDEIIENTREILKIKSVEDKSKANMPFGKGVNDSLEYVLKLCEKLGFKTCNLDNYLGYAEYGEGEQMMGILVHLDVVPEGNNWSYPPYGAEIDNGKIYARGAIDDKGPAMASIYALKMVKDLGIKLNKRVRIIFGTNEETDWKCMDYYKQKEEIPDFGFTPDAEFPVINGEKGIVHYRLSKEVKNDSKIYIMELNGGQRVNMVPDRAEIELYFDDMFMNYIQEMKEEIKGTDYEYKRNGIKFRIISKGISSHGSTPQFGINAITKLFGMIDKIIDRDCELKKLVSEITQTIGMDYTGKGLDCNFSDEESGDLTLNLGKVSYDKGIVDFDIDIRYPISVDKEEIKKNIESKLPGYKVVELDSKRPIYISPNDDFVKTLLEVYREATNDLESEPMVIGGGTYARAFDNMVAFGAIYPGQEILAHEKDEFIEVDHLLKLVEIYSRAIIKLAGE
ncbi:MAG: dipeptidase PepV [Andreesenia angusta]|nr:dipeptidase PepV [Andreesenia angusta]